MHRHFKNSINKLRKQNTVFWITVTSWAKAERNQVKMESPANHLIYEINTYSAHNVSCYWLKSDHSIVNAPVSTSVSLKFNTFKCHNTPQTVPTKTPQHRKLRLLVLQMSQWKPTNSKIVETFTDCLLYSSKSRAHEILQNVTEMRRIWSARHKKKSQYDAATDVSREYLHM